MRKFSVPNITGRGRVARAIWGVLLIVGASLLFSHSRVASLVLGAAGGFALFEAVRGWCVVRACGIKTRM